MSMHRWLMAVVLCTWVGNGLCKESGPVSKLKGQICAYGDIDRDLNTDLIVHDDGLLKIYLQEEDGEFKLSQQQIEVDSERVFCSVGDFNGDSVPDVLVSHKKSSGLLGYFSKAEYQSTVYIGASDAYQAVPFNESFFDQLSIMDVNGDGTSDVVGFTANGSFYCRMGSLSGHFLNCEHMFKDVKGEPFDGFVNAFVDITGDLSAEVVLGMNEGGHLKMKAFQRLANDKWQYNPSLIADLPEAGKYGAALFADFDADGLIDIGIPWCSDEACSKLDGIKMWNTRGVQWQHFPVTGLEGCELVSRKDEGRVVFRVGDFSLDGYPDLIALVKDKTQNPMVLENVPCTDCISNASRKFELRTSPRLIQPSDVSLGQVQMASFFDLKEDGTLDVLLEYKDAEHNMAIDFIRCEDKGDTTFLKVQVFSNACDQGCGSDKLKIGSGIAWHSACVMFNMSDSWGHQQRSTQCQMPQTTHRTLHTPFALFGLGRSPNFVDLVHIGSPRLVQGEEHASNQHHDLKQIVPNSRLLVVPPKGDGIHWLSRLYLTPSQDMSNRAVVGSCSICTSNLSTRHMSVLKCGHTFHYKCIRPWIEQSHSCPNCRTRLHTGNIVRKVFFTAPSDDVASTSEHDSYLSEHSVDKWDNRNDSELSLSQRSQSSDSNDEQSSSESESDCSDEEESVPHIPRQNTSQSASSTSSVSTDQSSYYSSSSQSASSTSSISTDQSSYSSSYLSDSDSDSTHYSSSPQQQHSSKRHSNSSYTSTPHKRYKQY